MGAWGYGLFQSDADLDAIGDISDQAGLLTNDRDFNFWDPKDRDQVVEKLSAGLFHQLLEKFKAKNWKHGIVYLGALSMQLGVKFNDEEMLLLKETLPRTRMYDQAKEQMRLGLEGYKNDGEAWDFKSPGVLENMDSKFASGEGHNGHIGMNVFEDWTKHPTPMPKDGDVEADEGEVEALEKGAEAEVEKENKVHTGKDALGDKAKLKAWFSS